MRKIIAAMFLSLDGVMQAPGGPDEDPTGGSHRVVGQPTIGTNQWDRSWTRR
jgi:hypothetical protein